MAAPHTSGAERENILGVETRNKRWVDKKKNFTQNFFDLQTSLGILIWFDSDFYGDLKTCQRPSWHPINIQNISEK